MKCSCGEEIVKAYGGFCSRNCYQKNYRIRKKVKEEGVSETVELSERIIEAVNLLREYCFKAKDLQPLQDRQSEIDKKESDYKHLIEFGSVKSPKEKMKLLDDYRALLNEKREHKQLMSVYKELQKLDGFTRINYGNIVPLKNQRYNPRVLGLNKISKDDSVCLEDIKDKPKSIYDLENMGIDSYREYVDLLNLIDLTSKTPLKTVNFKEGNLQDLKAKINQMCTAKIPCKTFRVEENSLMCYL